MDRYLHGCTTKRKEISLSSTGVNLLLQRLSVATTPESWLSCQRSLTTVRRQSKQRDGKYIGLLHNTVVMSQLELGLPRSRVLGSVRLGPGAALCWSSVFHCWPSPDSEKCWAGRSYTALKQRTLSTHLLYCMCPVKAIVHLCCISIHHTALNAAFAVIKFEKSCFMSPLLYHGKIDWLTGHLKYILYLHKDVLHSR